MECRESCRRRSAAAGVDSTERAMGALVIRWPKPGTAMGSLEPCWQHVVRVARLEARALGAQHRLRREPVREAAVGERLLPRAVARAAHLVRPAFVLSRRAVGPALDPPAT